MILIINLGSTTLKYEIYDNKSKKTILKNKLNIDQEPNWSIIWQLILTSFQEKSIELQLVETILHRVVFAPMDILLSQNINIFEVDNQLLGRLNQTADFAPLHNPNSLSFVGYIESLKDINNPKSPYGPLNQFLVFDNYLYRDVLETNYRFALPTNWEKDYQIRRYGYHGLAHKSMLDQLNSVTKSPKILTIQLGGGCSITAFDNGVALTNTMGFGTAGGLIMSTRSGDIDAGAILHMLKQPGVTTDSLEYDLHNNSGLLAIAGSEYKGDMRLILANQNNPDCKKTLEMFVSKVIGYIGSYWMEFGGFGVIAFGGGIGEGSDLIRSLIIEKLGILGIFLDSSSNKEAIEINYIKKISSNISSSEVWVIPVNEVAVMLGSLES